MPAELGAACALALAAVFGWAALAKALYWPAWRQALVSYELPALARAAAAYAVPAAELALLVLLLSGRVVIGAALTIMMLAGFSLAVMRAQVRQRDRLVPCGCFGRLKARDYRFFAVRNFLLGSLAAVALVAGREGDPLAVLGIAAAPAPVWVAVGAALAVVAVHAAGRIALPVRRRAG